MFFAKSLSPLCLACSVFLLGLDLQVEATQPTVVQARDRGGPGEIFFTPTPAPYATKHRTSVYPTIWTPRTIPIKLRYAKAAVTRPRSRRAEAFVAMLLRGLGTGRVWVLAPEHPRVTTRVGEIASDVLYLQQQLGCLLSERIVQETGEVTYHSARFRDRSRRATPTLGIRYYTHAAKVLPAHVDLGQYEPADPNGPRALRPAFVTMIAWGKRSPQRTPCVLNFYNLARRPMTANVTQDGTRCRNTVPAVQMMAGADIERIEDATGPSFAVEVPENALTLFTNRGGLAHGSSLDRVRSAKRTDTRISRIDQGVATRDPELTCPIDVILL